MGRNTDNVWKLSLWEPEKFDKKLFTFKLVDPSPFTVYYFLFGAFLSVWTIIIRFPFI